MASAPLINPRDPSSDRNVWYGRRFYEIHMNSTTNAILIHVKNGKKGQGHNVWTRICTRQI